MQNGKIGNQNAAKENPKKDFIHLRVDAEKRAQIVHAAQCVGMKLTAYILEAIDEKMNH